MMKSELRELTLRTAGAPLRTEVFNGRPHLVVPVIALVEGVVHAVNASEPEFVSGALLRAAARSFNGKPCVLGHPVNERGVQISAMSPKVLAEHSFGWVFDAKGDDALQFNAFIDPERVAAMGHQRMLDRFHAGQPVEISVGAHVGVEKKAGVHKGKRYAAEWTSISGDHLAFLPGGRGACSVEMGCGANRSLSELRVLDNPEGINQYTGGGSNDGTSSAKSWSKPEAGSIVAKSYEDMDEAKAAAKEADKSLKQAGFTKTETQRKHDASHKMGGSTAQTGSQDTVKVSYSHSNGDTAVLVARYPKQRTKSVAIHYGKTLVALENNSMHTSLRERLSSLFSAMTTRMTDEELKALAAEPKEATDRMLSYGSHESTQIGVSTISDLLDELKRSWGSAYEAAEALSSSDAAYETKCAHLDALVTHCMQMQAAVAQVSNVAYRMQPNGTDGIRYMEEADIKALAGRRNSAADLAILQSAHDASHDMHAHALTLGAECVKALAAKYKDCEACKGSGSLDGNPCEACDGEGQIEKKIRAAAGHESSCSCGAHAPEGEDMNRTERIKALGANKHCMVKSVKALEALTDDELKVLEDACGAALKAEADASTKIATLEAANTELTGKVTALETRKFTLADAPEELRSLVANAQAIEAERKGVLATTLEKAQTEYKKDELDKMAVPELERLSRALGANAPANFAGRALPVPPQSGEQKTYAPPDAYERDLKALQGGSKAVN